MSMLSNAFRNRRLRVTLTGVALGLVSACRTGEHGMLNRRGDEVNAPRFAYTEPGNPMVVSTGNDVGWQVDSIEAAQQAFAETGVLRGGTEQFVSAWAENGPLYAEHGVTAFEPYVKWMLLEPEEGVWDPEFYDKEVEVFRANGLKWVPFLIGGPAYSTPPWFKESPESVFAEDLATGDVSRDQSIWNPYLRPRIKAWLTRFFDHFDHHDMQAVLLGISGVFGESIYTAGGNAWTHIWDGAYPQHLGFWCGDEFAVKDFRRTMLAKYETIERLNLAWGTGLFSFDEVRPFVPDTTHSNRARLDMVRWYMGAMTDFAEWWTATVRELAPDTPILLCTGGHAAPELGADMSAQSKMMSRYGAGMRITNEASDYAANFHVTRHISSACRLYDTYFGYEPAGPVSTHGIVARVYNSIAAGAWELFHYDNPPLGERGDAYKRYLSMLTVREPVVEVGLFWSRTSIDLGRAGQLGPAAMRLRDLCDVDYVDELMIEDGFLDRLRLFVWTYGDVTEIETAETIRRAVERGMVLVVPADLEPVAPEGQPLFPAGLVFKHDGGAARVETVGKGAVVCATAAGVGGLLAAVQAVLRTPGTLGLEPVVSDAAAADAVEDKLYLAVTTTDILLYNHGDEDLSIDLPQGPVDVPAHDMVSVPVE